MKQYTPIPLFHSAAWLSLLAVWSASAQEIELFNGRDLTGWTVRGGEARFRVVDGSIVGKSPAQKPARHTFLATKAEFDNFILTLEFKADPGSNSGVQVRSQVGPEDRVSGYQCEIETTGKAFTGSIYDEGRRGAARGVSGRSEEQSTRPGCVYP